MIYAAIFIKDSYHLVTDEKKKAFDEDREENVLQYDEGNPTDLIGSILIITI